MGNYDDETIGTEEDNTFEATNNIQQAIVDSFSLFTSHDNSVEISVEDLGKVVRHLGCVPSEEDLNELERNVVDRKNPKIVLLNVFVPYLENQIRALRYKPGTVVELIHAFKTLDVGLKGSLSKDQMRQALGEGESFDDEEIAEAIKTAYDPDFKCILYDTWIHKLLVKTNDVYSLLPSDDDDSARREAAAKEEELKKLLL